MRLRDEYTRCLGNLSMDCAALLGVREVLNVEDLEYTLFLYESDDEKSMVLELGALNRRPGGRELCQKYVSCLKRSDD